MRARPQDAIDIEALRDALLRSRSRRDRRVLLAMLTLLCRLARQVDALDEAICDLLEMVENQ